ncbi:hypothetical protein ACVV2G_32990 [Streptomyces ziwulingensis]
MLPPIGAEIPCSMYAPSAKLEYAGSVLALEFKGQMKQRVEPDPSQPPSKSVNLEVIGCKVRAEADGMTVVVEQNDTDVVAASTLAVIQSFPPKFVQRDVLPFTVAFHKGDDEPVVLIAKKPMVLVAEIVRYPPDGDLYRLEAPVELVASDAPDIVAGRLTAFDCRKGGL